MKMDLINAANLVRASRVENASRDAGVQLDDPGTADRASFDQVLTRKMERSESDASAKRIERVDAREDVSREDIDARAPAAPGALKEGRESVPGRDEKASIEEDESVVVDEAQGENEPSEESEKQESPDPGAAQALLVGMTPEIEITPTDAEGEAKSSATGAPATMSVQTKDPKTSAHPTEQSLETAPAESVPATDSGSNSGVKRDSSSAQTTGGEQDAIARANTPEASGKSADLLKMAPITSASDATRAAENTQTTASMKMPEPVKVEAAPTLPQQRFEKENVDQIVQSVRSQLLPKGGQMHLRLDPAGMGMLQITVKVIDGKMTADFIASRPEAVQMINNNLQQLRTQLESSGMPVERLQVRASVETQTSNNSSQQNSSDRNDQARDFGQGQNHSEQQRREMVRKMWEKLAYGNDAVDLVA